MQWHDLEGGRWRWGGLGRIFTGSAVGFPVTERQGYLRTGRHLDETT
ncbi:hypothetical protein [Schlesneria sp.]